MSSACEEFALKGGERMTRNYLRCVKCTHRGACKECRRLIKMFNAEKKSAPELPARIREAFVARIKRLKGES